MIYIGIDPGVTGAVATDDYGHGSVWDIPTTVTGKGTVKREINGALLAGILRDIAGNAQASDDEGYTAILERTSAMPGQGVSSMFSMGVSRGVILGVLGALAIPYEEVVPAVWKRHFNLLGKDKDAARTLAIQMFPGMAAQLARVKDHNRAEALLLAAYLKQKHGQGLDGLL